MDSFVPHSAPGRLVGSGVTSIVFGTQDGREVHKYSLVPARIAFGWDGFRDRSAPSHCAAMERAVLALLARVRGPHVPATLRIEHIERSLVDQALLEKIPCEFVPVGYKGATRVQCVHQERVTGKCMYQTIQESGRDWSRDDWKSLLVQVVMSLAHLQHAIGYVQWDSHMMNLMVRVLERPVRHVYELPVADSSAPGGRWVVAPPSRLQIVWIDSSSATSTCLLSTREHRRLGAQRLWFNIYQRVRMDRVKYAVPVSVLDAINVLIGMAEMPQMAADEIKQLYRTCVRIMLVRSFSKVYGVPMIDEADVLACVKRDQVGRAGWTLPLAFYDVDPGVMFDFASYVFEGLCLDSFGAAEALGAECLRVPLPPVFGRDEARAALAALPGALAPGFRKESVFLHSDQISRTIWKRSLQVHSELCDLLLDKYQRGELVIPCFDPRVFERLSFDAERLVAPISN